MRRAAAVLLALAALSAPARAEEPAPKRRAFVEVDAGKDAYYVGEPIVLRLRVGYDAPWFAAHAAPLLRADLDVQVQVSAPFLDELVGTRSLESPARGAGTRPTRTLALNDGPATGEVVASRTVDGRPFEVVEIARSVAAERPGPLVLPAPTLRFAHAERIEENFLGERVAIDPKDAVVRGEARTVRVLPFPEEGKPESFSGVVGRYTARAQADRSEVEVGQRFHVTLVVEGEGNFGIVDAPRLDSLFHVYGMEDRSTRGRRTFEYDVAALDDTLTEWNISFNYFEPGPDGGYRIAATNQVPLRVRAKQAATTSRAAPDAWDADASPPETPRVVLLAAVGAALAAAGLLLAGRRRRRARRGAPVASEATVAPAEAFRRLVARGESVADAFAQALAEIAGCTPAAVVRPDLAARLRRAGVAEGPASRAAVAMEALTAERYGGSRTVDAAAAAAILDEVAASAGADPAGPTPP